MFIKSMIFICYRQVCRLLLVLSPTCPISNVLMDTLHTLPRYSKILANSTFGIALLVQKYYFIPIKLCYLVHYSGIQLKTWEQLMCFGNRQLLKIQFKIDYLRSCLLCVDSTLVYSMS